VIENRLGEPGFDAWFETSVEEQKQPDYAIATVRVDQGNMTSAQMRGVLTRRRNSATVIALDRCRRTCCWRSCLWLI